MQDVKTKSWKMLGSITGAGQTLAIPNEFEELLVVMAVLTGVSYLYYTVIIPRNEIPTGQTYTKTFYSGHYYSGSNFGGAVVVVQNGTTIKYGVSHYNNADAGFVYTVSYR
jgi:hypothetical protein